MADEEKALDTRGGHYSQAGYMDERSPVSDRTSYDVEKEDHGEKTDETKAAEAEGNSKDKNSESNAQGVIVNWDGPNDPEFPQNL